MKLFPSALRRLPRFEPAIAFLVFSAALGGLAPAQTVAPAAATPKADDKVVELPPFAVTVDDGTGYRQTMSTVGTRTNRPTIEIPQSLTMITGQMLEDTLAFKEEDAIRYVPNVFPRNTYGAPGEFLIRGFEREGSTYLDGFAVPGYRRDTAGYDRMEVIKGPPSAVQGRSGASGAINWVSKKPVHGKRALSTTVMYGADENYERTFRAVVDGNQTLLNKGPGQRLSVRAVGLLQEGNSMIQFLPEDLKAFYPSVRWDITPNTELLFFGEFLDSTEPGTNIGNGPSFLARQYRDIFEHTSLGGDPRDAISALNIPFGRNPNGPHILHWENVQVGLLSLTHRFNEYVNYRQGYQRFHEYDERRTGEPNALTTQVTTNYLGVAGVWLPNSLGNAGGAMDRDSFQGDLHVQFDVGRLLRSTTLLGYEWWRAKESGFTKAITLRPEYRRINLAAISQDRSFWDDSRQIQSIVLSDTDDDVTTNFSYYVQQEVDLWNRRLILMGAWRHDAQDSSNLDEDGTLTKTSDETDSYRYGLSGFLNRERTLSLYGVWSTGEDPERQRNVYGAGLAAGDPRTNSRLTWSTGVELLEFGLKAELFDNRLSLSAAWFEQSLLGNLNTIGNTPVESPVGSGQTVFVNVASLADSTVKGWEFQAVGDISRRLSLVANLAFMDSSEVRAVGGQLVTQKIHRVAEWNYNVFAKYDWRSREGNGWELRAGVHAYGDYVGTFSGVRTEVDHPFIRFDAGVRYTHGRNSLDFFVKNLTDEPIFIMRGTGNRAYRCTFTRRW